MTRERAERLARRMAERSGLRDRLAAMTFAAFDPERAVMPSIPAWMAASSDPYTVQQRINILARERQIGGQAGLTKAMQGHKDACLTYSRNPHGNLLLLGSVGSGKTHLAAAIANERLAMGKPAVFVVVPELLNYLRQSFQKDADSTYDVRSAELMECGLLILDDLGAEKATPWVAEQLYLLFNHRYNAALPTVVTSNCSPARLEAALDERVISRLLSGVRGGGCRILELEAGDYRPGEGA